MALLAEEVVEEWLNRAGYFTIRGVMLGVHEMDLLAIRPTTSGIELRHIEVQASIRPVSYVTSVPKDVQKASGRKAGSARKREEAELRAGVKEWIAKKFLMASKQRLRQVLCPGVWTYELVVYNVKYEEELRLIGAEGVKVHRLSEIVEELAGATSVVSGASGGNLLDLVFLGRGSASKIPGQQRPV